MIPSDRIRNGCATLWEKTPEGTRQVTLAAVDAAHALQADPERWSLDEPEPEPKPKRRGRHHEDDE